jgi:hypothetical protein
LRAGDKTEFADIVFHRVAGTIFDDLNNPGEMRFECTITLGRQPAIALSVAVKTANTDLFTDCLPVWSEFRHGDSSGGKMPDVAFFNRLDDFDDERVIAVESAGELIPFLTDETGILRIARTADILPEDIDIAVDRFRFDGEDAGDNIRQETVELAFLPCGKAAGAGAIAVDTTTADAGLEHFPIIIDLHDISLLSLIKELSGDRGLLPFGVKTRSDLIEYVEFCPKRFFCFFQKLNRFFLLNDKLIQDCFDVRIRARVTEIGILQNRLLFCFARVFHSVAQFPAGLCASRLTLFHLLLR